MSNRRPISVVTTFAKLTEKLVLILVREVTSLEKTKITILKTSLSNVASFRTLLRSLSLS